MKVFWQFSHLVLSWVGVLASLLVSNDSPTSWQSPYIQIMFLNFYMSYWQWVRGSPIQHTALTEIPPFHFPFKILC